MPTVMSKDGTKIVYDKSGQGPAVILVAGATMTRAAWSDLANLLAPHLTAYAYDRRGRGESGDTQPYTLEREFEDIQALLDNAGGTAYVYGISSGASLSLEAAAVLGNKISKLAVYEAPYASSDAAREEWQAYRKNLDAAIAAGRNGEAVELFMGLVGVPKETVESMRQSPMRPQLEAIAPTLRYDAEAMGSDRSAPLERAAKVTAKTLVMDGEASYGPMPFMKETAIALAKAIPNAVHQTIAGQSHNIDSAVLAPVLIEFFTARE